MNNKIIVDSYIMYGLNRRRAFLTPPTCEDCGHDGYLVLSDDELKNFCGFILTEHDCDNCALFVVHNNDTYEAYMKIGSEYDEDEEEISCDIGVCRSDDMHMFATMDGEFKFCCYSLLMETGDGIYEIKN